MSIGSAALILSEDGETCPHLNVGGYLLSVSIDGAFHPSEDTFDFQNYRLYYLGPQGMPTRMVQFTHVYMLPKRLQKAGRLVRMLAYVSMHQEGLEGKFDFLKGDATESVGFMEVDILDLRDYAPAPQFQIHIHEDLPEAREIVLGALTTAALSIGYSLSDSCVRRETCPQHNRMGYVGTVAVLHSDHAQTMLDAMTEYLSAQVMELDVDIERKNTDEKVSQN